jgi:beta-lactamase class D/ABC-type Zn uptake system ZnuABC Zn-binding protein ZnuA
MNDNNISWRVIMKNYQSRTCQVCLGVIVGLVVLGSAGWSVSAATLKIIVGTSNIAEVVQQIGGADVEISTIIPGGACPGHYDVRPGDIKFLTEANALLLHPWQKDQVAIQNLLTAAGNLRDVVKIVAVKGNWLIPDVEAQAITAITQILQGLNPAQTEQYAARAQERLNVVQATGEAIRAQLEKANVANMPVLCADMQQEFVAWAGFQIVGVYGRPEELTPAKMAELLTLAKEKSVKFLIDNLQSGKDAGKGMAEELGAAQVTISNFVGGLPETDTWKRTVTKNVELMIAALPGDAEDPDLAKLFQDRGVKGTVVIDALDGQTRYLHNLARAEARFLPASTFKIPNTLIALAERAIKDEKEIIKWDGSDKGWKEWNKDQTLETAFPLSCVWFYQELAKRVGNEAYLKHLQKMPYGNQKTGPDVTTFWLEGDLRISPLEQIKFLKRLYKEDLPYSKQHTDVLKRLMIVEQTPQYTIRAKTGWTMRVTPQVGWYVGYVETRGEVWFFATNLEIVNKGDEKFREEISIAALKVKGIIP